MESTATFQIVWWAVIAALVVGGSIYAYIEYHAYLLRTHVKEIAGGLQFTSQLFSVESRHASKEVVVQAGKGHYSHQSATDDQAQIQTGSLTATFAATGLRMTTASVVVKGEGDAPPIETGFSNIVFNGSDELMAKAQGRAAAEQSTLRIDHVPNPIARDFQLFAHRLHLWIDKLEHAILMDLEARRKAEEERVKAEAREAAIALGKFKDDPKVVLTEEQREARAAAQIASWREAAGFKGSSTEVSINARGKVVWFVDLDPAGRIILHAADRTYYGSLKGARVTSLTGELEIAVRDDYWTENEPQLVSFKVLTGAAHESRRAWKERLDILIKNLGP
jgi:hypothetical protein